MASRSPSRQDLEQEPSNGSRRRPTRRMGVPLVIPKSPEVERGMCPHCGTRVRYELLHLVPGQRPGVYYSNKTEAFTLEKDGRKGLVTGYQCPDCERPVLFLEQIDYRTASAVQPAEVSYRLIWPRAAGRPPLPAGVDPSHATDYLEAALVLQDSPNASAALSRRCLQAVLHDEAKTKSGDLIDQIDEVRPNIPDYLYQQLDNVRRVGNYAAHPKKSKATGEIVDVEPGEAEQNLQALDDLFDYYHVKLPRVTAQTAALDARSGPRSKP